jgi:ABC-2 type transport system ATP-binding protein
MTLEIRGLSKSYGDLRALAGLDFTLEAGSSIALLGPNGAGKTTAIRSMVTLLSPDEGAFLWQGRNLFESPHKIRDLIGYVSQEMAMDKNLTGREFMRFCAAIQHLDWRTFRARAEEMLEHMGLADAADRLVGEYSGGMKRRLDLAVALLNHPRILILDEPTTGLDIEAREQIWDLIGEFMAEGGALILASHDFREVQQLAHQVLILKGGEVVERGEPQTLKDKLGRFVIRIKSQPFMDGDAMAAVRDALSSWSADTRWFDNEEFATVAYRGSLDLSELHQGLDQLMAQAGLTVHSINVQRPDLEDVYRLATGDQQ